MHSALKKNLTFLKIFLFWGGHALSFLSPRSKKVCVFIGWHVDKKRETFADNAKYLFLHASKNKERYGFTRVVWLTPDVNLRNQLRSFGHESYLRFSLRGILSALAAKYTITDAYLTTENWICSGGSRVVQLWHGIPLKKFGRQRRKSSLMSRLLSPGYFIKNHTLVVTSEYQIPTFTEAFNCTEKEIFLSEYPRNTALFLDHQKNPEILIGADVALLKMVEQEKYSNVILYAPTFRRGRTAMVLEEIIEIEKISTWAAQQHCLVIIGLHPKDHKSVSGKTYAGVYFLASSDIYPLLKYVNILISDYSSIPLDFLLLDRPQIFYTYDLEQYENTEGVIPDYNKHTPGEKVHDKTKLLGTIIKCLEIDTWKKERGQISGIYHERPVQTTCEEIMTHLLR